MKCQLCGQEVSNQEKPFNDSMGNISEFSTYEEALKEIIKITKDKRTHVMYIDALNWEKVKLKGIQKIAKQIIDFNKE